MKLEISILMFVILSLFEFSKSSSEKIFNGDGTVYKLNPPSGGNCNFMTWTNGASSNYVAMNDPQFKKLKVCGQCVEVWCVDKRCTSKKHAIVQILDRCPECKHGDLDLSPTVYEEITGSHPSRLSIEWKFVSCPTNIVKGSIQYCLKEGSNDYWTAIQPANFAHGISSMKINGEVAKFNQMDAFYFLNNGPQVSLSTSNVQVELTSVTGETIQDNVRLSVGKCTKGLKQFSVAVPTPVPTTTEPIPTPTSVPTPRPTTARPTTARPTTPRPTTAKPTTPRPTTARPTTVRPTTARPTTSNPSTREPTVDPTMAPTTETPTTGSLTKHPPTPRPTKFVEEPTRVPFPSFTKVPISPDAVSTGFVNVPLKIYWWVTLLVMIRINC